MLSCKVPCGVMILPLNICSTKPSIDIDFRNSCLLQDRSVYCQSPDKVCTINNLSSHSWIPSIVDSSCWRRQESLLRSVDDLLSSWPGLMDHKLHTISRWCLGVRIDNIWNKSGPENVTSINTSQTLSQSAPAPPRLNSKRLPWVK